MIFCNPRGICSWDFSVIGLAASDARVHFDWFTEQGLIAHAGGAYQVTKESWLAGRWVLQRGGEPVAEARKPSAFFRMIEVTHSRDVYELKADSAFTRAFTLRQGSEVRARIRPVHAFTRRATIELSADLPPLVTLFSFWLAALMWRRTAQDT